MGRPKLVTITCVLRKRFSIAYADSYALAFVVGEGRTRRVAHILHLTNRHAVARAKAQMLRVPEGTEAWAVADDLARVLRTDVDVYIVPDTTNLTQVRRGQGDCVLALQAKYRQPKQVAA